MISLRFFAASTGSRYSDSASWLFDRKPRAHFLGHSSHTITRFRAGHSQVGERRQTFEGTGCQALDLIFEEIPVGITKAKTMRERIEIGVMPQPYLRVMDVFHRTGVSRKGLSCEAGRLGSSLKYTYIFDGEMGLGRIRRASASEVRHSYKKTWCPSIRKLH